MALRGAGDVDRNGRVSLDEAYRYAYEHTLTDTARTQVGSQHATLETELTGRGDVPLTYPIDADAQLAFAPGLEGRVLVQQEKRGPVMAELVKAKGAQLLLALPSGTYEVLVRADTTAKSCRVALAHGTVQTLALDQCQTVTLQLDQPKIARSELLRIEKLARESWFLESGLGLNVAPNDGYVRTLQEFGYSGSSTIVGADAALGVFFNRYFGLLARFNTLEAASYTRSLPSANRGGVFDWRSGTIVLGARLRLPLARHWLVAFAELDGGLGYARSTLSDVAGDDGEHDDKYRGFAVRGLGGLTVGFTRHFGMYLAAGWTRAPMLENELGERHDSGGFTFMHGLRLNGTKGWW